MCGNYCLLYKEECYYQEMNDMIITYDRSNSSGCLHAIYIIPKKNIN